MDFTAWLVLQTKRKDPIGDLAGDVADDPNWPQPQTREAGLLYLDGYASTPEMARAAGLLYRDGYTLEMASAAAEAALEDGDDLLESFDTAWAAWEEQRSAVDQLAELTDAKPG